MSIVDALNERPRGWTKRLIAYNILKILHNQRPRDELKNWNPLLRLKSDEKTNGLVITSEWSIQRGTSQGGGDDFKFNSLVIGGDNFKTNGLVMTP